MIISEMRSDNGLECGHSEDGQVCESGRFYLRLGKAGETIAECVECNQEHYEFEFPSVTPMALPRHLQRMAQALRGAKGYLPAETYAALANAQASAIQNPTWRGWFLVASGAL